MEIFPIYPDFDNYPNPYSLLTFDQDPINPLVSKFDKDDHETALRKSFLCLEQDQDSQESWFEYFAPVSPGSSEKVSNFIYIRN